LPVFFSGIPTRTPNVAWSIERSGGAVWLVGRNSGNRRVRISDVTLTGGGSQLYRAEGLVGYVLPGAERRWAIVTSGMLPPDGRVHMTATGDTGPIDVALVTSQAR